MKHKIRHTVAAVLVGCLTAAAAQAADGVESRQLRFAKNTSSATVKGSIQGRQTIDYKLRARAGQTMTVKLESRHSALAFNVLPPGSTGEALPDAISLQSWSGVLPRDGEYSVRTYLPRSAGRRGELARYTLTVAIAGAVAGKPAAMAGASPVQRAGEGKFDARGRIPCAQASGQPMTQQCDFGVARGAGGAAAVVVTLPDSRKRMLFFEGGKAVGADLSQADGDTSFQATKEADLYRIRAGKERYEVPEAVVTGG